MENTQNQTQNKTEDINNKPISLNNSTNINHNTFSYSNNHKIDLSKNDPSHNNNLRTQNLNLRNERFSENFGNLEINVDLADKSGGLNDSSSDIKMNTPSSKNNIISNSNHFGNQEEFLFKKMSIDLDGTTGNASKKFLGCNCKNSGCLKRYCECFSRMRYCSANCQCKNCYNNINNEKKRSEAIKVYMIKSPIAFNKINIDINNITCNCKKSNCLKNYCECFQFGLKCSHNCGCVGCKNRNFLEKKLFFVENNCDSKNGEGGMIINNQENIINEQNNMINLREEETNINNINNNININVNNKIKIVKKNNTHFIVNKNVNTKDINNNISLLNNNNRARFLSFDDASQWNNLNLKKVAISHKKLIIDNYNINQPDDNINIYQTFQPNFYYNNNFINNNENSNNIITTRKNSAFSAIIK